MNEARAAEMRSRAERAAGSRANMLASLFARDVLELLDERAAGRRLAEERFDSEMSELRDEFVGIVARLARLEARL